MENYNEIRDDEIEIDLKELFLVLWRKAWIIILSGLLFGVAAFGYTSFLVTPLYDAQSMIYILSSSTSLTSITDLQLSSALTEDYVILGTSRPVIEEVIENLELDYTYAEMVAMININNPSDSHVLQIQVTNESATTAMNIANEMANVVSDQVASVMATDTPRSVERAVLAESPSSPSVTKNTAIGILLGLVLSAGIIVVIYILDDTIKNEDDVVKYLGKSVLATLPREGGKRKGKEKGSAQATAPTAVHDRMQSSRTIPDKAVNRTVKTTKGTVTKSATTKSTTTKNTTASKK